jgi:hypothetical protein
MTSLTEDVQTLQREAKGHPCSLEAARRMVPETELAEFNAVLLDDSVQASVLSRAIQKRYGVALGRDAISRHRGQQCVYCNARAWL